MTVNSSPPRLPGLTPLNQQSNRLSAVPVRAAAAGTPADQAFIRHLAKRATAGPTPELIAEISKRGWSAWLDEQLAPSTIVDTRVDELATRFPGQNEAIWWLRYQYEEQKLEGYPIRLATACDHVARLLWSKRQVQTQIVDFFANHLNVPVLAADELEAVRPEYQGVIRRAALGKYSDLLTATIRHPAMLIYLDNRSSTADHPNENLGRELLELHTVGVGNFAEMDVLGLARVLTGLSVCRESHRYEYKPWYHWTGTVRVLGWSHANSSRELGYQTIAEVLGYLARHPATARRICLKLAQRFVATTPPATLVDRMSREYLAKDTAIAPVLKLMFSSPEFAASTGALVYRPMDSLVAVLRTLGHQPDATGYEGLKQLVYAFGNAGQFPLNYATPDGFPLDPQDWSTTANTLQRWNTIRGFADHYWPATLIRPTSLLAQVHPGPLPKSHSELLTGIFQQLLAVDPTSSERAALLKFLGVTPSQDSLRSNSEAVTWRLPELVAAILSLPRAAVH